MKQPSVNRQREAIAMLTGVVHEMAGELTEPAIEGFDAEEWLHRWLAQPVFALGGRPIDLLDTDDGIQQVQKVFRQMQSGAYG